MPLARIHLRQGKSANYVQALADNVHRALTETFDVPLADRFQIIHQLDTQALQFDHHYGCGPRSDDYVLIEILCGKPRSTHTKRALYSRLVALLGHSPGLRSQDVMVIINTTQREDWSFGDGIASMIEPTFNAEVTS